MTQKGYNNNILSSQIVNLPPCSLPPEFLGLVYSALLLFLKSHRLSHQSLPGRAGGISSTIINPTSSARKLCKLIYDSHPDVPTKNIGISKMHLLMFYNTGFGKIMALPCALPPDVISTTISFSDCCKYYTKT